MKTLWMASGSRPIREKMPNTNNPQYIYASGAVVLALGITYWLLSKKTP